MRQNGVTLLAEIKELKQNSHTMNQNLKDNLHQIAEIQEQNLTMRAEIKELKQNSHTMNQNIRDNLHKITELQEQNVTDQHYRKGYNA